MKRVVLYIRVSTDEQVQHGTSLKFQREALDAYCKREGLKIIEVYQDDGYSGGSTDRPAFQRLIKDADSGTFDTVLVHRLDRFSRSLGDAPNLIIRHFGGRGIAFKSLTENFDSTTPHGRMMLGTLSGFADFERERIKERSKDGKRKKASLGYWVMGLVPFGYVTDKDQKLVIDRKEATLYRRMVQWSLNGESTLSIARKLNAMGALTKHTKRSTKGKVYQWKAGTVHSLLKNPCYSAGEFNQMGSKVSVPPLVSRTQWERLGKQMRTNFNNAVRHTRRFYLLRGLLKCKKCGRGLYGLIKENRGMYVYCCLSKRPDPDPRWCGLKNVRIDKIDTLVWEAVRDLLKDSKKLREAIERTKVHHIKDVVTLEAQIKWIDKQVVEKDNQIGRVVGLYGQSKSLSVEDLDVQIGKLKGERDIILGDQRKLNSSLASIKTVEDQGRKIAQWAKGISSRIDRLSKEKRRELLQTVLRKVVVDWDEKRREHRIEIEGAIPIFGEPSLSQPAPEPAAHCFTIPSVVLKQ